ncbi:hypothetical protein GEAM_1236 [Ewingella americana ATCC 33852]|uniref:Uncharacterized protein n=1 Tax=Ewingella americana (strain ATCC 33852 / DSM 4580 / CCUG 14506 / JCM 5911 / LMG 7869 / NCTC 12157 / CDC 1468-78) TaxID=910964 RepID=A0A085GHH1_EWIA3|nr:hypothetical protein GEAM_1236 [Ewingella americana ATCC 33852]
MRCGKIRSRDLHPEYHNDDVYIYFIRQPLHTYCILLVHVINNISMVAQAGQLSGWPVIRCGR